MQTRFLFVLTLVFGACQSGPQPIRYGHDACAHCRMTVLDKRYGAELVTATGKAHVFDSVECLAAYERENPPAGEGVTRWVAPFDAPGTLVPAGEAFFLHTPALRSPMGLNLTAFSAATTPESARARWGGEVLDWDGVLRLVAQQRGDVGTSAHLSHP